MAPRVELVQADALDWLRAQEAESFQCLVLDPPYNVGFRYATFRDTKPRHIYLAEQHLVLGLCAGLLRPGGSLFYLNYPETVADLWGRVDFLEKVDWLAWVYHAHTGGAPLRKASRAWAWFSKGAPKVHAEAFAGEYRNPRDPRVRAHAEAGHKPGGYDWLDLEQVKNTSAEKREHPCQVPGRMVERFILGTTDPGDLVGDCYLGSGTTALAAQRLGRTFAGCDLDAGYLEVARKALGDQREKSETPLFSDLGGDQDGDLI